MLNTPPQVDAAAPTGTNSISCGSGTLAFSVTASDADGDTLTYTWAVNGVESHPTLTASTTSATFAPTCALSGDVTITVSISDGYATSARAAPLARR